jgi:PilZ domain
MAHGFGFARQPAPADRRRSPRLRLQVPIFVRGLDIYGEEFLDLTKTLDISAVGASLASPRPLHLNELVSLRIPAPSPSSSGLVPEASPPISARVIREQPVGDIHLVAVEFVKPLE